jgi:endogenous inhibitor of DNA gyrase (YacG/DUF329 family)
MPPDPIPSRRRRCPLCGKPADPQHRPFCSGRCKLIDLGRWLDSRYRFATDEAPDDGSEPRDER